MAELAATSSRGLEAERSVIAEALSRYALGSSTAEAQLEQSHPSSPRLYRAGEVVVILAVFAAAAVAFGSEGLLTWAQRLEAGPLQRGLLAALRPVHRALDAVGGTAPRRAASSVLERFAQKLGAGEDPLFAGGWSQGGEDPTEPSGSEAPKVPAPESSAPEPAARVEEGALASGPAGSGERVTLLLLGDSMLAGSLGSAISRGLGHDRRLRVVQAVQSATGLSRPDVFDWMKVVPPLLERERPRLIVCSLGANDTQRLPHGDQLLEFGEPAWRALYQERVMTMMRALSGSDARVLWLGQPPMRDPGFSRRARGLNRVFMSAAAQVPRAEYLQLDMLVSGPDGDFASFIPDSRGRFVRVRMDDGVHYSPAGARLVARWVVDWVYERLPTVRKGS